MKRALYAFIALGSAILLLLAYSKPAQLANARASLVAIWHGKTARAVEIGRAGNGDFFVRANINGKTAPMVLDSGATSVILTYETAKAAGLPLEVLHFGVDVETASGHTRAASITLDRLAIGKLTERAVPALVAPPGKLKTNLLGMGFLDRLESWEVRGDKVMLRGYP